MRKQIFCICRPDRLEGSEHHVTAEQGGTDRLDDCCPVDTLHECRMVEFAEC
jgi:hypothetical protein